MVDDGVSALLVPVGDAEGLGRQTVRLLADPVLSNTLRAAGLEAAAEYGWPTVREKWLELYRMVSASR
jgi:glycosyltransferase involved in cell wall biosynthesis